MAQKGVLFQAKSMSAEVQRGKFVDRVRAGKVPGPTTRKFSKQDWEAVAREGSGADRDLAVAGLFVSEQFQAIRNRLGPLLPNPDSLSMRTVQLCVGFANGRFQHVAKAIRKLIQTPADARSTEVAFLGEHADDFHGDSIRPDESLEKSVTATAIILRSFKPSASTQDADSHAVEETEAELSFDEIFRLANFYGWLEELWWECLWTDCQFIQEADGPVFRRQQSHWGQRSGIAELRRFTTRIERALPINANERADRQRSPEATIDLSFDLIERDGVIIPSVRSNQSTDGKPSINAVLNAIDQRSYPDELLQMPLVNLHNFNAAELLAARNLLAAFGRALEERLVSEQASTGTEFLLNCAPIISRESLGAILQEQLGLPEDRAHLLLSCFIFGDNDKRSRDLYHQPLIDFGENRLLAMVGPLVAANLERDFDYWFSRANLADRKGPHFEADVRNALKQAISKNKLLGHAKVYEKSLDLKSAPNGTGDIDLVIQIRHKILSVRISAMAFRPRRRKGTIICRRSKKEVGRQTASRRRQKTPLRSF
jgi:hypothetical protein